MRLDYYQEEARRTAPRTEDAYPDVVRKASIALAVRGEPDAARALLKLQDIHIWAHGLAGEAGEVCDLLKKVHGHGKPCDREALVKELGDVMWYLANLADAHGITLSEVAAANVEKLRVRYANGFSVRAAAAKADETPRVEPVCPAPGATVCHADKECALHGCSKARRECFCPIAAWESPK